MSAITTACIPCPSTYVSADWIFAAAFGGFAAGGVLSSVIFVLFFNCCLKGKRWRPTNRRAPGTYADLDTSEFELSMRSSTPSVKDMAQTLHSLGPPSSVAETRLSSAALQQPTRPEARSIQSAQAAKPSSSAVIPQAQARNVSAVLIHTPEASQPKTAQPAESTSRPRPRPQQESQTERRASLTGTEHQAPVKKYSPVIDPKALEEPPPGHLPPERPQRSSVSDADLRSFRALPNSNSASDLRDTGPGNVGASPPGHGVPAGATATVGRSVSMSSKPSRPPGAINPVARYGRMTEMASVANELSGQRKAATGAAAQRRSSQLDEFAPPGSVVPEMTQPRVAHDPQGSVGNLSATSSSTGVHGASAFSAYAGAEPAAPSYPHQRQASSSQSTDPRLSGGSQIMQQEKSPSVGGGYRPDELTSSHSGGTAGSYKRIQSQSSLIHGRAGQTTPDMGTGLEARAATASLHSAGRGSVGSGQSRGTGGTYPPGGRPVEMGSGSFEQARQQKTKEQTTYMAVLKELQTQDQWR